MRPGMPTGVDFDPAPRVLVPTSRPSTLAPADHHWLRRLPWRPRLSAGNGHPLLAPVQMPWSMVTADPMQADGLEADG